VNLNRGAELTPVVDGSGASVTGISNDTTLKPSASRFFSLHLQPIFVECFDLRIVLPDDGSVFPNLFARFPVPVSFALTLALSASLAGVQKEPQETLIRMSLTPMTAPRPALRYMLLPELKEMTPGNPIEGYLQSVIDQNPQGPQDTISKSALRLADRAARMDKPDWQILPKIRTEGFSLIISDVQGIRALAAALKERFQTEISSGHIDDALVTAKTMFAISRHMSEHPSLISQLVAIAIAHIAFGPLDELLQQPNCPNLYWAFTNLPNPLISLDRGMGGERLLLENEFRDLDDTAPMTKEQIKAAIRHIDRLRAFSPEANETTQVWLDARTKNPGLVEAARKNLVEYGIPEERAKLFPAEQVILLDQRMLIEVDRDDVMKLMNLPAWQALELSERAEKEKPRDKPLLAPLGVVFSKVRLAQGRLEQRIALFRHIEAIRMYAANHNGKLPDKLGDITVPLPVDPFTGKPFRYSLEGSTAHLRGNPPHGLENFVTYNLHYEITIRK
jgi:hypothetical protein